MKLKKFFENTIQSIQNILKIEEENRSSNISLFFWDAYDRIAYFRFHSGDVYKYFDVDPMIIQQITKKNAVPVTEGNQVYGEWSPNDKESLGAALYQYILKNPKYKRSAKGEPGNPNYRKMDTVYDYWNGLSKGRG